MKKHILAVALCMAILQVFFPAAALAGEVPVQEEPTGTPTALWVDNVNILGGGTVPGVNYNAATNTLTLNGANITQPCSVGYSSGIYTSGSLNIVLTGTNTIFGSGLYYGIEAEPGSLVFSGTGTLDVMGIYNGIYAVGSVVIGADIAKLTAFGIEGALYAGDSISIGGDAYTAGTPRVLIEKGTVQEIRATEIRADGVSLLDGSTPPPGVSYHSATNTLTLTNAALTNGLYADGGLKLVLSGENTIAGAVEIGGNLTVGGQGSLFCTGESAGMIVYGNFTVAENAEISASGINAGIQVSGKVNLGGTAYVYCTGGHGAGIAAKSIAVTETAMLTASGNPGISSEQLHVTESGILSANLTTGTARFTGGIWMEGNTGSVKGSVKLLHMFEIFQGSTLTIPDGSSVTLAGQGSICNNGTIRSDGYIYNMPPHTASVSGDGRIIGNSKVIPLFSLSVSHGSGTGYYPPGTAVTIQASPAPEGQVFDRWIISGSNTGSLSDAASNTAVYITGTGNASLLAAYTDISAALPASNTDSTIPVAEPPTGETTGVVDTGDPTGNLWLYFGMAALSGMSVLFLLAWGGKNRKHR